MRRHIPRICAGVVVLAFFLPWIKVDLGPMGDFSKDLPNVLDKTYPCRRCLVLIGQPTWNTVRLSCSSSSLL